MKSIWELAGGDTEVGRKMDALVEEALGSVTEARQQEQLAQLALSQRKPRSRRPSRS